MPDNADAQILQVFRRQARKNRFVNLVLAERSLISFEAKAPQPTSEVHNGAPRLGYVLEPLQKGSLSKGKSYYHSRGFIGILKGGPSRLPSNPVRSWDTFSRTRLPDVDKAKMSEKGPGRVKTFFLPQKLHAAGRNSRRRDRLSLFLLYRVRSQSGRNLAPRRTT